MKAMTIRNDDDLRIAWGVFTLNNKVKSVLDSADAIKAVDDYQTKLKKAIRKYNAEQKTKPERRYFDSENAGYYRVFGETDYNSVAEAEELHEPITCYPDQLGRWYEISHKFFKRSDGKVCGYAWMAMNW